MVQIFLFQVDNYFSGLFQCTCSIGHHTWRPLGDFSWYTLWQPACSPVLQRDHVVLCFTICAFSALQDASQDGNLWSPKRGMDWPSLVEEQTPSWCSKMKPIISDMSDERNTGFFCLFFRASFCSIRLYNSPSVSLFLGKFEEGRNGCIFVNSY